MQPTLETPIEEAPYVAPRLASVLKKLGIRTVRDLLLHLPARYEDFSVIRRIHDVKPGETVTVRGIVTQLQNEITPRKRMTLTHAIIEDETGALPVLWFNQPYLVRNIKPGNAALLSGKVQVGKDGMYLSSPAYELVRMEETVGYERASQQRLVPVYPETAGITSRWLRFLIRKLLPAARNLPDSLPPAIRAERNFPPFSDALHNIHFPKTLADAEKARERLRFEELFAIECAVLQARAVLGAKKGWPMPFDLEKTKAFIERLPFTLTDDQRKAAYQILKDMEKPRPMNRLLVGDVGSGKTVVAALAALNAVHHGFQVAVMAPTEILAEQHFKEFSRMLKPFRMRVGLLTGALSRATPKRLAQEAVALSKRKFHEEVAKGAITVIIGTHALISGPKKPRRSSTLRPSGSLRFHALGLAIVDEQHRFGIDQRGKLAHMMTQFSDSQPFSPSRKSGPLLPHFLTMTATPIPRTLALTIFGDLDFSLITQLPRERKKVITEIIGPRDYPRVYEFLRAEIREGRQGFIIYPLVEESEKLVAKAATKEHERLSKNVFPDLRLALLHGRMKPKEKETIMKDFKAQKYDVLVSTSVIEVGIDVPNAAVMIIEGVERFGLAQLYQFRGRVGRGTHQSYCFLFCESEIIRPRKRLKAFLEAEGGHELAKADLAIRGPGELAGIKQAGLPDVAMSGLMDLTLIEQAREYAVTLLTEDPRLKKYSVLRERVSKIREELHFA